MATPVRAIFFTRQRPAAQLAVTRATGGSALPETGIAIRFSSPVEAAAVAKAFSVEPPLTGRSGIGRSRARAAPSRSPGRRLRRSSQGKHLRLPAGASVADGDGVAISSPVRLEVRSLHDRGSCAAGRWGSHEGRSRPDHQRALLDAHGQARHAGCAAGEWHRSAQGRQGSRGSRTAACSSSIPSAISGFGAARHRRHHGAARSAAGGASATTPPRWPTRRRSRSRPKPVARRRRRVPRARR